MSDQQQQETEMKTAEVVEEADTSKQTSTVASAESKKSNALSAIPIGTDGRIMARDHQDVMRVCKAMILGEGVPRRFDTPEKLFSAIMFVRELKLPDTSIRQVANVHGMMCTFGDLPLALVQRTGELTNFKEQWFDGNYKVINFENQNLDQQVYGAVCFMGRGKSEIQSFSFTLGDAEKAGLFPAKKRDGSPSPDSPWNKYTKLMLRYKARSIGLKSMFADAMNGVGIAEYDHDVMPDENFKDVGPRVASRFLNSNEETASLNKELGV